MISGRFHKSAILTAGSRSDGEHRWLVLSLSKQAFLDSNWVDNELDGSVRTVGLVAGEINYTLKLISLPP